MNAALFHQLQEVRSSSSHIPEAFALSGHHESRYAAVLALSQAARRELREWSSYTAPKWMMCSESLSSQLAIWARWMVRLFGFGRYWCTRPGFWAEWARLGGESRISMLITIARFDEDGDGHICKEELANFEKYGKELVTNAVGSFGNCAIILSLLIGATHLQTISRPVPWSVSPLFASVYGIDAGEAVLWVAYGLNCLTEVLCIIALVACIFHRFLITNAITTLDIQLCLLVKSNAVANTASISAFTICLLCILIALGGIVGQDYKGLLAFATLPLFVLLTCRLVARWFCEVIKRQHEEVCLLFAAPFPA
mmetsp:Transcript_49345/g.81946  ORF Transcript_49345/g.81946 Transcript_49345/m.81946 type:complete len:311 (-) Transcript_49345:238-1170(-)|eukprot:CAMPEP_0119305360 /NCGR_PEP_ID=MMETSP1333-20130426/6371_1 /TAXON_ID=418940 /ORGANISM="Scyphosphaera apsteinii, Strain RCC1455" /LENGTH=310 /DNA_ID=CAMNT_0007308433 /DNA_START=83 /DNA_END=1015 /DNA_ORIENTATION=-